MAVEVPDSRGAYTYICARIEGEYHTRWHSSEVGIGTTYREMITFLAKSLKIGHLENEQILDMGAASIDLDKKRIEYGGGHPGYPSNPKVFKELIEANTEFEFVI